MSSTEIFQMCKNCHECSHIASLDVASITEEKKKDDCSYPLSFSKSSHLSNPSAMSESSKPNLVYRRRKLQGKSAPNFVYSRRKLQGNSVGICSARSPACMKRSGEDSVSAISSDAPSIAFKEQQILSQGEHTVGAPVMPYIILQGASHLFKSESINGCLLIEERGFDEASKIRGQKIIEVNSINDSCSSSMSGMELVSASMQTEVDETGECSSSSAMIVEASGEDGSEKDLSVSIIRSQGVIKEAWPSRSRTSTEDVGDSTTVSSSWVCKVCSNAESTLKMLICDNCEEAFHLSCCNPRVKRIPLDEWFCHSCSKKRSKILKEKICRTYPNMIGEKGRCRSSSINELNPIALMLRDAGSYASGVRIGKGFQAEVPDWSGPITKDVDTVAEALEVNPLDFVCLTRKSNKPKLGSIGNWLQCREVMDATGESTGATICGKWRRAPLFEVQTDDWECFCSVLWDPIHADCAVPQELDTDEILKQLKYIEMLRPRLAANRRKLGNTKNDDDSKDNVEDVPNT
ncbi:uncharacterized protein LOC105631075 isoform X2 [Jatropha curcas]|uniref:uncharacterized protein LOC105631075 isoform X2 n=1 Tax=Jatropha curcas TaxID=180498 RepID=UPI0005FB2B7D|nr:uncharacterized protein LOC105631075 isoform X2 [Jatropha curcas]